MENSFCRDVINSINIDNAATYYRIAELFRFSDLKKRTLSFIRPRLSLVVKTCNFKELDLKSLKNILDSSSLHAKSSELEAFESSSLHAKMSELIVFKAALAWIEFTDERNKHAEDLLLKIRLPLLSDDVQWYISSKKADYNSLHQSEHCVMLRIFEKIWQDILQELEKQNTRFD